MLSFFLHRRNISMERKSEKGVDEVEVQIQDLLKKIQNVHYIPGPIYSKSNKMLVELNENELEKIYHLVETHAPNLRFNTIHRFEKALETSESAQPLNKSYMNFHCSTTNIKDKVNTMLEQVAEMPKEWTIIQLTSQLNTKEHFEVNSERCFTNAIHVTVFNCGSKETPFCITVDPPINKLNGSVLEIRQEMYSIIKDNVSSLENFKAFCGKTFKHVAEKLLYSEVRFLLNSRLEKLVKEIQNRWLCEWRCLLIGKYINNEFEDAIQAKVDTLNATQKEKNLLKCLIKGWGFLKMTEITNGLSFIFPGDSQKDLRLRLGKDLQKMHEDFEFSQQSRHPVILIVDEKLDILPWEMLDVLENQPASRMPCLHFTYSLYKEHESNISDGMVTNITAEDGTYLINPGLDLKNMENRLRNFFNYWVPDWKGLVGVTPTEDDFKNLLTTGNIFIYSGHGNGTQFFASEKIQRMKINKVVLLFGCSSVSLTALGPQVEMFGSYQMYLTACSPCVVGMLWPVTDIDTDVITTEFLSQWIPSAANIHWKLIDKKKWETNGNLPKTKNSALNELDKHEPELLRALSKAKKVARQYLMKAACVARGLPVKINTK